MQREAPAIANKSCKARLSKAFLDNLLTNYEDVKRKPVYRRGTTADVASTTPPPFFSLPAHQKGRTEKRERTP